MTAAVAERAVPNNYAKLGERLCFAFVFLWIFEGGFRKWVPGADGLFYVARDGLMLLGLLACVFTAKVKLDRFGRRILVLAFVVAIAAALSGATGDTPIRVLAIGLRSYLAPAALILLASAIGTARWIAIAAKVIVVSVPIELAIVVLQVTSSPGAFVNRETVSDSASFVNSGDIARASGTFSAPAGLSLYIGIALAILVSLSFSDLAPRWRRLGIPGALGIAVMVALSGSRTAVSIGVITIVAWSLFAVGRGRGHVFRVLLGGYFVYRIVQFVVDRFFPQVLASFEQRIEVASQSENASARVLGNVFGFLNIQGLHVLGVGPGAGSGAAIQLNATASFAEAEAGKWVFELGLIGFLLAIARFGVVIYLLWGCVRGKSGWVSPVAAPLAIQLLAGQVTAFPTAQGHLALAVTLLYLGRQARLSSSHGDEALKVPRALNSS